MTIEKNDSTTKDHQEQCRLAQKLVEELAILLEHDDKSIGKLLLLIDLFERNSNDTTMIKLIAGEARARAYGMSDHPERQSHEFVNSLRASHLANLSEVAKESSSDTDDEERNVN